MHVYSSKIWHGRQFLHATSGMYANIYVECLCVHFELVGFGNGNAFVLRAYRMRQSVLARLVIIRRAVRGAMGEGLSGYINHQRIELCLFRNLHKCFLLKINIGTE